MGGGRGYAVGRYDAATDTYVAVGQAGPTWRRDASECPLQCVTYDDDECEDNGVAEKTDGSPVVSSRLPISFGLHNIYVTSKKTTKIVGVIVSCSSTRIGCAPSMNSVASS